jgi:hypothetical protein
MSHTMMLQHHYGQHLFGDDLTQGARMTVRVHKRPLKHALKRPMQRLKEEVSRVVEEVKDEIVTVKAEIVTAEERIESKMHGAALTIVPLRPRIRCLPLVSQL